MQLVPKKCSKMHSPKVNTCWDPRYHSSSVLLCANKVNCLCTLQASVSRWNTISTFQGSRDAMTTISVSIAFPLEGSKVPATRCSQDCKCSCKLHINQCVFTCSWLILLHLHDSQPSPATRGPAREASRSSDRGRGAPRGGSAPSRGAGRGAATAPRGRGGRREGGGTRPSKTTEDLDKELEDFMASGNSNQVCSLIPRQVADTPSFVDILLFSLADGCNRRHGDGLSI